MKLNKLRIRLLQFFGFGKDICHQDDISIEVILSDLLYVKSNYNVYENSEDLVIETKRQILERFSEDAKFESNCRKVKQVWVVYYLHSDKIRSGGQIKQLYYDGELFYPGYDQKSYDRHMKLKELGL
jgi:hypothetical protein